MSPTTLADPAALVSPKRTGFSASILFAFFGFFLLWAELINHLRSEWSLNPQYSYGWSVPFLALFSFWQRWARRPMPGKPFVPIFVNCLVALAILALLPARIIAIANPDWRLLSWALAGLVTLLSFQALNLAGGWGWMRHFAFPVLFFLVAVPWPAHFEQTVVQSLMRADAAIVIELLNAFGILAVQHGNVIEMSTGMVGIDDACTGVRSLQATLMLSLFLGELYRLNWPRRLSLIGAGAVLAFVCNIGRTLLLCLIGADQGVTAIHRWHDSAGLTILMICLFALWALGLIMRPRELEPAKQENVPLRTASPTYLRLGMALGVWLVFTELAAAAWYHGQAATLKNGSWTVAWPTNEEGYKNTEVPEAAQQLLRYNDGGGATWGAAGKHWIMYYFRWLPGRTAALFVKNHRPDICLPASGMTMQQDNGIHVIRLGTVALPIHSYRFSDQNGRPLYVFYCYWDSRSSYQSDADAATEDWTARGRLRAAWRGQRDVGSRMLEIAVWGFDDDQPANEALQRELEKVVVQRD